MVIATVCSYAIPSVKSRPSHLGSLALPISDLWLAEKTWTGNSMVDRLVKPWLPNVLMATDWFRKTTWSALDQQDFETRLKRSRDPYNKSQYLRIQASHLQGATPPLYKEALQLIERVLTEHRDDSQVASALLQKAQCLCVTLGFVAAISSFREGLEFERSHPKSRTQAWIEFPWWIVKERRIDLYDEALENLSASPTGSLFPIDSFRINVICAVIKMYKGDTAMAKSFAKDAVESSARKDSGFRYHKTLGLVDQVEPWVAVELKNILGSK